MVKSHVQMICVTILIISSKEATAKERSKSKESSAEEQPVPNEAPSKETSAESKASEPEVV